MSPIDESRFQLGQTLGIDMTRVSADPADGALENDFVRSVAMNLDKAMRRQPFERTLRFAPKEVRLYDGTRSRFEEARDDREQKLPGGPAQSSRPVAIAGSELVVQNLFELVPGNQRQTQGFGKRLGQRRLSRARRARHDDQQRGIGLVHFYYVGIAGSSDCQIAGLMGNHPTMVDRTMFRSGLLPTAHFNDRFSDENVSFWVPLLIERGQITASDEVLDVGCGTGGFARAIAAETSATVIGIDEAEQFLAFAIEASHGAERVSWQVASAEALPFPPSSFDRVLLSLVLHQLADPVRAVNEAFRVLRAGGVVLVRSIAPEDAPERVPERFVPSMAAADAERMPAIATIRDWLAATGFADVKVSRHLRNKVLNIEKEEAALRAEVAGRYRFVSAAELEEAVQQMRSEAARRRSSWIDPRPTYVVTATKRA